MSNDGLNLNRLLLYRQILKDATIRKAQELVLMMDTPGQKTGSSINSRNSRFEFIIAWYQLCYR
jgi:hypothetical protein